MKQLTIEDAKQIELEILDYIDTLCKSTISTILLTTVLWLEQFDIRALFLGTTILICPCLEKTTNDL